MRGIYLNIKNNSEMNKIIHLNGSLDPIKNSGQQTIVHLFFSGHIVKLSHDGNGR
jgi:hypothetical protein